jgi:hypothetical protein
MNFKLPLFSIIAFVSASNLNSMVCLTGSCPLARKKVILAHRVINHSDKIRIGYKINPKSVTAMIHLPTRPMHWFVANPKKVTTTHIRNLLNNSFDTNILYGADNLTFSVRDGKFVTLIDNDFTGRTHRINTNLPQQVGNLIGKVEVLMHGNTVEIKMPRQQVVKIIKK